MQIASVDRLRSTLARRFLVDSHDRSAINARKRFRQRRYWFARLGVYHWDRRDVCAVFCRGDSFSSPDLVSDQPGVSVSVEGHVPADTVDRVIVSVGHE